MCCLLPFKKLQPESPNQPCSRGRRYVSHPASQPLVGTMQNYPSDPNKSSDCGGHPGSTKHLAICAIHGRNHSGRGSSSMTDHDRHQVALSAEEGPLAESWAPEQADSQARGMALWMARHRVAPSWMTGLLPSWLVLHCVFVAFHFGVPCAQCS